MLNNQSFMPEFVRWCGCVTLKNVGCNSRSQSRRLERLLPDAVKSMQRSILHFILYLDWSQQASWSRVLCHRIVFHWSLSARQTNHLEMWGFGNLSSSNDLHRNHLGSLAGFSAALPRVSSLGRVKCNHHFPEALWKIDCCTQSNTTREMNLWIELTSSGFSHSILVMKNTLL